MIDKQSVTTLVECGSQCHHGQYIGGVSNEIVDGRVRHICCLLAQLVFLQLVLVTFIPTIKK